MNRKRKRRKKWTRIIVSLFLIIAVIGIIIYGMNVAHKKNQIIFLKNMNDGEYDIKKLENKREQYEKELDIKEINYNWTEQFTESNNPKELVIHHTSISKESPEQINDAHKDKGWNGIGYHFYIRKDGTIYRGRPEEVIGSHTYGRNRDTIGICLEGDFEKEKPTNEQMDSLVKLSTDLVIKYNIENIEGHSDLNSTLCPGKNFPMKQYKETVCDSLISLYDN